jgi:hypothetical protein
MPTDLTGPHAQLGLVVAADTTMAVAWGVVAPVGAQPLDLSGRYLAAWQRHEGRWEPEVFLTTATLDRLSASSRITPPQWTDDAEPFVVADQAFAADVGAIGAAAAFARRVAPHGVLFGAEGRHVIGPDTIARQMAPTAGSRWSWGPVAAGSSRDGSLGWTIRWIADGGNARP